MKYNMNFVTRTLTISRDFANMAVNCPNSKESYIIEQCRALCPDLKIAYYTRKKSSSKAYNGLTYNKMERYIKLYENATELLAMFNLVKEIARVQKSKMKFVYNWFIKQFPNYTEMPEFRNGKLYTKVISIPEVKENEICIAA